MVDTRLKYATSDTYIKHLANCIEQPAMGVDLLLILGFQDKDDLNRN